MADHVHKQLRDAAVTALTGLATTGANCYGSRVRALPPSTAAALKVYVQSDVAEEAGVGTVMEYSDTVELRVEAIAKVADTFDDVIDQIKKEVLVALSGGLTVAGVAVDMTYTGSEVEYDDETELPAGSCVMRFDVVLYFAANAPDVLQQV